MTDRSPASAPRFTALAIVIAALGVAAVYAGQLDNGFYYDDYHFIRPWSPQDLHRVWFGSWDPTGLESVFYRPLSAEFFAGRFWLLGSNVAAMHTLSALGHVLCAVVFGWFLRRAAAGTATSIFGVALYAVYPSFPHSQVSWLTNQMHLLESVIVLGAFLLWQSARDRWLMWLPIALLAFAAILVKEDGAMLLPALGALTLLHALLFRPARPRFWALTLLGGVAIWIAMIGFRFERLGRLGGYGTPTTGIAIENFLKGIVNVGFLWPTRTPWRGVASAMAIASIAVLYAGRWRPLSKWMLAGALALVLALAFDLPAIALPRSYPLFAWQALAAGVVCSALVVGLALAIARADKTALFLILGGAVVLVAFDAPFALVSKREQYHLLTLGAVLSLSGACRAILTVAPKRATRAVFATAIAILLLPLPLLARTQAADFLPCGSNVLGLDQEARGWWVLPEELQQLIDRKAVQCRDGVAPTSALSLPRISWGLYRDGPDGEPTDVNVKWTSDRVVFLLGRTTTAFSIAVQRPDATVERPVRVTLRSDSGTTSATLDSPARGFLTVHLKPTLMSRLRQQHRVDLTIDEWFVPAVRNAKSADLRRFGVLMEFVDAR